MLCVINRPSIQQWTLSFGSLANGNALLFVFATMPNPNRDSAGTCAQVPRVLPKLVPKIEDLLELKALPHSPPRLVKVDPKE